MTPASVKFAQGAWYVETPAHLVDLRHRVRREHGAQLAQVHSALNAHSGTTGASDDYVKVF